MMRRFTLRLILIAGLIISNAGAAFHAGQPPFGLFFREDWKETPPATPVTQEHVVNQKLTVRLYGPGKEGIKKSHHDQPKDDPFYIWSGSCAANWALTLRHVEQNVDLSNNNAKIRWRTKQTGFRQLHIIVKLADGTWLVSEQFDGETNDWHEKEFAVEGLRWRKLDIEKATEGRGVEKPNLNSIEEVGFTDLMSGGGTPASSRVDWIEVVGKGVRREATKP
jgi:hypothetical protein